MLVLASASPRRQQLLENAGIAFVARPTNIPEVPRTGEAPRAFAERLAKEKAFVVFQRGSGDFVLGADTVVVVDAQILGKPKDVEDAARMLRLLSGRTHDVVTGICLFSPRLDDAGSKPSAVIPDVQSELTVVTMESLADEDIRSYIATGEPMDKAGSYAIQGIASRWISRIEGDYSNVVGLPVSRVYRMLKQRGAI
jgi:septum formation protein